MSSGEDSPFYNLEHLIVFYRHKSVHVTQTLQWKCLGYGCILLLWSLLLTHIEKNPPQKGFGSHFVPNPGNSLTLIIVGFGFGGVKSDT